MAGFQENKSEGWRRRSKILDIPCTGTIFSMNSNNICHKQELRIITIKMNMGKGGLGKEMNVKEKEINKRNKLCYVHAPKDEMKVNSIYPKHV